MLAASVRSESVLLKRVRLKITLAFGLAQWSSAFTYDGVLINFY